MNRQKGQSAVELALILPLFFMMCFGMIYGGMFFMDYLSLNNLAYEVARKIALATDDERLEIKNKFENKNSEYVRQITNLYTPIPEVTKIDSDVEVEIKLVLNENNLPKLLTALKFPPKNLKPIKIVMPMSDGE